MPDTIGAAYIQIKPTTDGLQSSIEKEMSSAGNAGGKSFSSAFGKIFGTTGAVIGGITTAIGGMGTALVNAAGNVAEYGDNIDKMSQKMGISAEAYQEWDAVMQHSGTSMETLKASMKTMANAAESGNEAFAKLGISEQMLSEMSQEDLFSQVITGLQNMEAGTERTYLAGQLLGRGATELGALLNTSAEDTQKMKDQVHELNGVLSDDSVKAAASFQDQLQDMQTSLQGIGNNLISEFLPGITQVMGGLTDIFKGGFFNQLKGEGEIGKGIDSILTQITDKLPEVMKIGTKIIFAIVDSIVNNLPKIVTTGMAVIKELILGITDMLPELIQTAADLIVKIVDTLAETLPEMLPKIITAILGVIQKIIDNLPEILTSLLNFITLVVDALLKDGLPIIIAALPDIIMGIIDFILTAIPQLINTVITIVMALAEALPEIIQQIVDVLPDLISNIIDAILENLPLFVQAGIGLVDIVEHCRDGRIPERVGSDPRRDYLVRYEPRRVGNCRSKAQLILIPLGDALYDSGLNLLAVGSAGLLARSHYRERRLPEPVRALILAGGVEVGAVNVLALRALVVVVDRGGAVHGGEALANAVDFTVHPVEVVRVQVNERNASLALSNLVLDPRPAAVTDSGQRRFPILRRAVP